MAFINFCKETFKAKFCDFYIIHVHKDSPIEKSLTKWIGCDHGQAGKVKLVFDSHYTTIMMVVIFILVVPDFIWVLQSNQYDDDVIPMRDPQCTGIQGVLTCPGSPSILFDGVIGEQSDDDYLPQFYTWQQQFIPRPYVAMSFDPPLEELSNITLYFYDEGGDIQAGISFTMCFSRSLNFNPCHDIEVPDIQDPDDGVVVHSVMPPTNTTSVRYLRIDMELLPPHDEHPQDYIFLSEIRVAERRQGTLLAVAVI